MVAKLAKNMSCFPLLRRSENCCLRIELALQIGPARCANAHGEQLAFGMNTRLQGSNFATLLPEPQPSWWEGEIGLATVSRTGR
jgi:hypothetical protein